MTRRAALLATFVAVAVPAVLSACPNACSGHGTCGEFDSCSCYANWEGGDCSLRTCPYQSAWVTTTKGDVNFDGDTYDTTVYDDANYLGASGFDALQTQQLPGGDWEFWPGTFNEQSLDEGHFYMECSNRGVCDRKTGICKCFDGYAGDACRRAACPENCNGHGTCKTVNQQKGTTDYNLWDGDMSRNCICDPGFTGASCNTRVCPRGDDPLTTDQHNEIQWVDIWTDFDTDAGDEAVFSGTITVTYTDHDGKQWTTDPVAGIKPYDGSDTDMQTNLQAALRALPGANLGSVTVLEGHCSTPYAGVYSVVAGAATEGVGAAAIPAGTMVYVDGTPATKGITDASTPPEIQNIADSVAATPVAAATLTGLAGTHVHKLAHWNCVRFKIKFNGVSGDIPDLSVDTSGLSIEPRSDGAGSSTTSVSVTVADTITLGFDGAGGAGSAGSILAQYTKEPAVACTDCAVATNTITSGGLATFNTAVRASDIVEVDCNGTPIGRYTVSTVVALVITLSSNLVTCANVNVGVKVVSPYIETNVNLGTLGAGFNLEVGSQLSIAGTFAAANADKPLAVTKFVWEAAPGGSLLQGRIFLDRAPHTATIGVTTAGTDAVLWYSKGTSESSECSDRGVCNSESGVCKCFKGYTGSACSTQNALTASG